MPRRVITGAAPSDTATETLSSAAALPGVTPVPASHVNRISIVLPTVAGKLVVMDVLTIVPYAPVFLTVFVARRVVVVVSHSSAVIIS